MPDQDLTLPRDLERRALAKGLAWSAPVVLVGTAAPAYAASCDVPVGAWSTWTNVFGGAGTTGGGCGNPQPEASGKWWLWCNGSTSQDATLQKCLTVTLRPNYNYVITFTTEANQSNPIPDAPANLRLTMNGTQIWAGYTVGSNGKSGNPGGTNSNRLITGTNGTNFTNQTWTVNYNSGAGGTVTMCFNWTAFARTTANGSASTDDIGTSLPKISC